MKNIKNIFILLQACKAAEATQGMQSENNKEACESLGHNKNLLYDFDMQVGYYSRRKVLDQAALSSPCDGRLRSRGRAESADEGCYRELRFLTRD